ncbi:hypothetical protein Droror1_Dr00004381 [Drosera rotundifolia]
MLGFGRRPGSGVSLVLLLSRVLILRTGIEEDVGWEGAFWLREKMLHVMDEYMIEEGAVVIRLILKAFYHVIFLCKEISSRKVISACTLSGQAGLGVECFESMTRDFCLEPRQLSSYWAKRAMKLDYQDRDNCKDNKALEVIWRGSLTFGSSSQIFANAFPVRYGPPDGFHFEVNDISDLLQDDPDFSGYNVDQRVNDFVGAAYIQTMGDDFQYQYAESWLRQVNKFIHYVNKENETEDNQGDSLPDFLMFPLRELEEKRKEKSKVSYERRKQLARLRAKAVKVVEEKLGSQLDVLAPVKY